MILLLSAVTALMPTGFTADWYSLLQTEHTWECSADHLISGDDCAVLAEGLPVAAIGSLPSGLPWPDAERTDPLESGLWGGGMWNTTYSDGFVQDSVSVSRIGLMQNTLDHSRYIFELDRPLPWGYSGNFEMARNDSVALHSAVVVRDSFKYRLTAWEGNSYGWGAWTLWSPGPFYTRGGFSRLYSEDRRPELLAGIRTEMGQIEAEFGAAGAYVDSTVEYLGAGGFKLPLGSLGISANVDHREDETGFWGGVTAEAGDFTLSAMYSSPGDMDDFQALSARHEVFTVIARFSDNPAVAADVQAASGFFRGKAAGCWYFDNDSAAVNCHALLGYDWYRARLEAGPRFTGSIDSTGEWQGKVDAVIGFTLLPFAIGVGLEDITGEDERSWSFGLTWSFTDQPPQSPEGDDNGER